MKQSDINRKGSVISNFLRFLNAGTDMFVLKGGTALAKCYNLDRFSEDIDLDCTTGSIEPIVDAFCKRQNFDYVVKKSTAVTERMNVVYDSSSNPLKIEVSYRNTVINSENVSNINGIAVYTIDRLANLKLSAYEGRDRTRDLYDIAFIFENYRDQLKETTLERYADANCNKSFLEMCQYYLDLPKKDPLVDLDKLTDKVISMDYALGGRLNENEMNIINSVKMNKAAENEGNER